MTSEEKELLLKDLSARLLYEVIVEVEYYDASLKDAHVFKDIVLTIGNINKLLVYWVSAKPYLRPMSSMTEEERKELSKILNYEFYVDDDFALVAEDDRHRIRLELCEGYIDWLNAHHFDFRGLIPMGLAIEAPEGMYKNE